MDFGSIIGILVALAAMVASVYMDGGHLSALWKPSSFVLIVGGTIGMTMASFPLSQFLQLPRVILQALLTPKDDIQPLIDDFVRMTDKARKEGVLALEGEVAQKSNPLLRQGLQMVVDGVDPEVIKATLEQKVELDLHRGEGLAAILEAAGGYSPTVGIIGTVMGLVHVLSNLAEADKLGPLIAAAFLATFYGIFLANVFWLPLATKLKGYAQRQAQIGRMILIGLMDLQVGQSPTIVREKLEMFHEQVKQGNRVSRTAEEAE